jgi:pyridoxal 5'-phosphate synthase pdxT subunit
MVVKVGLLALQGNYDKHSQILDQLGMKSVLIRYPHQLDEVSGLIIPGGESTTMSKLIDATGFRQSLTSFAQQYPILGTCAGLIMIGTLQQQDERVKTLDLIDITVTRNAYGRQLNSFVDDLTVSFDGQQKTIAATFIRAPQINAIESNVEVLARYNDMPVAVRQGHHIGLTFHPELNDVSLFHQLAFGGNSA